MFDDNWLKSSLIIFLSQLVATGLFALSFYYVKSELFGFSALLGGLVCCGPLLLANAFMGRASNTSAHLVLAKVYIAVIYKMVISICLFVYIFKYMNIEGVAFAVTYVATYVTQYAMSYILHNRN
jgi:F0F1-type ATP synthase assembly protein I